MQKRHRSFALGFVGAALFTFATGISRSQTRDGMQDGSLSNLARGKPCQVFSSHEEQGWSAAKLTDGITGPLGWSSKAFAAYADHSLYPEFVVVDLQTNCALRRVLLHPRSDGTNAGKGFAVASEPNVFVVGRGNERRADFQHSTSRQISARAILYHNMRTAAQGVPSLVTQAHGLGPA